MDVLLVSPEISPFAKTGGLGDVVEVLPIALNELGVRCSAIMPLYSLVRKNGYSPELVRDNIPLKIGGMDLRFGLYSLEYKKTKFFFIKNDDLYKREGLYGTHKGDYEDNALRFGFFTKAVLESLPYVGKPGVLHCNEWQTGLISLYLKSLYKDNPAFKDIKVLFTIHNLAYQGLFGKEALKLLDIPERYFVRDGVEFYGKVGLLKAGIIYSDAISTVSEGYSREILTKEFGCGLEDILNKKKHSLYGIVNGADYATWNPRTDKFILKNYGPEDIGPKTDCKKDLVKEFEIPFDKETPLVGMITRLAHQKGVDIVIEAMDKLLDLGVNFVILGTGDERYNNLCADLSYRYKGRAGAKIAFDNPLAHKIEAGCDMFLMPSRYEPCGLNQMYSLKYGTLPIARDIGGLKDTIRDFSPETREGNGFKFKEAKAKSMLEAVGRAVEAFRDKELWSELQKKGMRCDFSWQASAKKYVELYKKIVEK